jgi:hypothetical protein
MASPPQADVGEKTLLEIKNLHVIGGLGALKKRTSRSSRAWT